MDFDGIVRHRAPALVRDVGPVNAAVFTQQCQWHMAQAAQPTAAVTSLQNPGYLVNRSARREDRHQFDGPRVGQAAVDWYIAPKAKLATKPKPRECLKLMKLSVL